LVGGGLFVLPIGEAGAAAQVGQSRACVDRARGIRRREPDAMVCANLIDFGLRGLSNVAELLVAFQARDSRREVCDGCG